MNRIALTTAVLLTGLTMPSSQAQQLRGSEIRPNETGETGKLVAFVDNREVNVATDVLRTWPGWHSSILLYAAVLADGRYKLSYFNAVTGTRQDVTSETARIEDVSVAQLDAPHPPVLVIFLRDKAGIPGLALADPETGVFRRARPATAGAILNNRVTIQHFTEDQFRSGARVDLKTLKPVRTEQVRLDPPHR